MKVSIITVCWNAGKTIRETLLSVAAQTYPEIEHIVVDGGSTDDTIDIIGINLIDNSIFLSEPDNGLYDAMNKGIDIATGDLIGFLNADDFYCRTDAIELIVTEARRAHYSDAICGGVSIVQLNDTDRSTRAYGARSFRSWMLRFGHMPPHPGFYARASAFSKVGKFDSSIRIGADFEWMVRFFVRCQLTMAAIPQTLVTLREGGLSNDGFASRRTINAEALVSLKRHGIFSAPAIIWSKYLIKGGQMLARPFEWPAHPDVRWKPGKKTNGY